MEKLTSFIQSILFSRFIDDINYIRVDFLKEEKSEEFDTYYLTRATLTEQFDSFHISYQRRIEIRRIDDDKLSVEVIFQNGIVKTNGGISICEFPQSSHYHEMYLI